MSVVALVVDDSMVIRHTVCRFLEERGYTVESASNGLEAAALLERLSPGLVITDLQMPEMSGSELITVLKNNPETANIPVVIITNRSKGSSETRAQFTIFKDIDIEQQLETALASTMKRRAAKGQASAR
jgi:CheY-like chemotaxis protein